jgi:hypothetical protein
MFLSASVVREERVGMAWVAKERKKREKRKKRGLKISIQVRG